MLTIIWLGEFRIEVIETLAMLLNFLRSYEILSEVRPTNFHFNGKRFIRFHDASDCVWADILLSTGRLRMPANSTSEEAEVIRAIEPTLESLKLDTQKRKTCKSRTNRAGQKCLGIGDERQACGGQIAKSN